MRRHRFVLALAAAALLPIGYAEAGTAYLMETKAAGGESSDTMSARMSVEGPNLLVDVVQGSGGGSGMPDQFMFLGDEEKMMVIDHRNKTFTVMDKETMKAMSEMMSGGMEKMIQEALKDVPEEQRAEIEKMMREQMGQAGGGAKAKPSPIEYSKTGQSGEQQGIACEQYVGKQDGAVISELCVADWDDIKGGSDARDTFKAMAAFWQEAFGSMMAEAGENPMMMFDKIDGFPVIAREMNGDKVASETVLKSVEDADVKPEAFQPPAGYTQQQMGM